MDWRRDQDRWQKRAENKRAPPSSLNGQHHRSRNVEESTVPVDKEKLRAMFYPDSDSDDDPIATIKRRQIAANKRKRELAEANAIPKNVGLKSAPVIESSIMNISNNSGEEASETCTVPKRHCTTPQHVTITNERKEPKSSEEVAIEETVANSSDAIDLSADFKLSTPKISQLSSESGLSSETSSLRQIHTPKSTTEMTILKKDEGEETLILEKDTANETEQHANSKAVQESLLESDSAALSSAIKVSSTQVTPAETSPIIAKEVKTPKSVSWTSLQSQHLLVRSPVVFNPRDKVAGFDLDQTLVNWNLPPGSWPSSVQQYELWNSSVIDKLRKLDKDGYKLVIFSNQGGIKGALQGKVAARVKSVIDWIAKKVGRPVFAICSTLSGSDNHKPNSGMWEIMENRCNAGLEVRPDLSFFVGDSDGTGEGYQLEGVDKAFAEKVGRLRNVQMKFYTPKEFFGDSNLELRKLVQPNSALSSRHIVPKTATLERAALFGGYVQTPLLLILVGVQGSGKSTFSTSLGEGWCHLSQDTINKGRPGERKDVEAAARSILKQKQKSVVIDRMHLDAAQRQHFIQIGKEAGVHVHCLVFMASKEEISKRVKQRTNHPGAVEGELGAQLAVSSLSRLVSPTYDEGFTLINYTFTGNAPILDAYTSIGSNEIRPLRKSISLENGGEKADSLQLQMITLGTFKLKKQDVPSSISLAARLGIISIDTAPTYGNGVEIGNSLRSHKLNVTVKVPKRAIHPNQAREEVMKSLSSLKLKCADVVLLHWPSDLIEAGTLLPVWKELESMKKGGLCKILGVCNFSISALQKLIPMCTVRPSINQVERHPLLPQYELLDYCSSVGVVVQAHSPLGGGNLLQHDIIGKVAKESGMSPAQALISWNLQQGVPVVVKSSTSAHLREITALLHGDTDNLALSANHMKELSELNLQNHRFVAPPFMFRPGTVYSWEEAEAKLPDEYIEPAIPNTHFSIGIGEEKLPFVLYMAIRETKSGAFAEGIAACEASCPPSVHSHCFQRDGTRHVTLFQGDLTKNQARMLKYEQDHTNADVSLPLDIDFDG